MILSIGPYGVVANVSCDLPCTGGTSFHGLCAIGNDARYAFECYRAHGRFDRSKLHEISIAPGHILHQRVAADLGNKNELNDKPTSIWQPGGSPFTCSHLDRIQSEDRNVELIYKKVRDLNNCKRQGGIRLVWVPA